MTIVRKVETKTPSDTAGKKSTAMQTILYRGAALSNQSTPQLQVEQVTQLTDEHQERNERTTRKRRQKHRSEV